MTTLGGLCPDCVARSHPEQGYIHSAGMKPLPQFKGEHGPWYGMELEVDGFPRGDDRGEAAQDLGVISKRHGEPVYLKTDGSLVLGFEIVSQPLTIEEWNQQTWLAEMCESVKENGGRSFETQSCGVHLHRSRKDLSELDLSKLVVMFMRLQPYFERVAQRRENGYCSYAYFQEKAVLGKVEFEPPKLCRKVVYKAIHSADPTIMQKYMAINLSNPDTVECRIFRGTLCVESLLAYVHFYHYLLEFVKNGGVKYETIVNMEQKELWTMLAEFLAGHSLVLQTYFEKKEITEKSEKKIVRMARKIAAKGGRDAV